MMRKKVLVIDDEKSIRDIIGEYLTEEGFEFVEAPDGIRGLEIFRSVSPDLVILDVMMPKWTAGRYAGRSAVNLLRRS